MHNVSCTGSIGVLRGTDAGSIRREGGFARTEEGGSDGDGFGEFNGIHAGAFLWAYSVKFVVLCFSIGVDEGGVTTPYGIAVDDEHIVPDVMKVEVGAQVEDVEFD